jgi:hypothetical protein
VAQVQIHATLHARAGLGWLGRTRRAIAFGLSGRDAVVVSLAGFMLRGGVILLAVPAAILPSVLGLAGAVGVNAFAIDGRPTTSFFELVAAVSTVAAIWLLAAALVGSLVDVWLIQAALDRDDTSPEKPRPLPSLELLLSMAGVRAACLVPLALALAWAGSRIYTSAYNELTTPSSLGVPLAVRVVLGAADAVAVVVVVWLVEETVGAVAIRRLVLTGCGAPRAIRDAIVQIVRRPVTSAATVLLSYLASLVVMAGGMAMIAVAFDWCRAASRIPQPIALTLGIGQFSTTRDFRPVVFLLAGLTMGIAWLAASLLAGLASAWRSATLTGEVANATARNVAEASESDLGLSETTPATSGH